MPVTHSVLTRAEVTMRPWSLVLLLAFASPSTAMAGIPLAWQCRFDTTLVLCPAGDVVFHGYVARFGPYPNADVHPDFAAAPAVRVLPALDGSYLQMGGRTFAISNGQGLVAMSLRGGGVQPQEIVVFAGGAPICRRPVASFDQDGDLVVSAADEAIVSARLGSADRAADYDGDLVVTEADLAALRRHRGHAAESPTLVSSTTWGRVKSLWR